MSDTLRFFVDVVGKSGAVDTFHQSIVWIDEHKISAYSSRYFAEGFLGESQEVVFGS